MKYISLIIAICIYCSGFSQNTNEIIKISDEIEIMKLTENVYMHISYRTNEKWGRTSANGLIYLNKKKAFLFDTPWNEEDTKTLVSWIEDSLNLKLVGFIPNHWHEDCMGGLAHIKSKKIKSYASEITRDIAKDEGLPIPEIGFKDSLHLKLKNKKIECYFLGAAHTLDNIVIWLPSEKLLFAGCILKGTDYKSIGYTADGDINEYPNTLRKILAKFPKAEMVVPGHGTYGGIELIHHNLNLLNQ